MFAAREYSFVAKIGFKKLPFCDGICTKGRTIFVDRKTNETREKATKKLIERSKLDTGMPILAIYPEGTVTNGEQIKEFKKGAFLGLNPIKI